MSLRIARLWAALLPLGPIRLTPNGRYTRQAIPARVQVNHGPQLPTVLLTSWRLTVVPWPEECA